MLTHVLSLVCSAALAQAAAAAEPAQPSPDASERLAEMKEAAAGYLLYRPGEESSPFTLIEEPVLRYSDNITQVPDGSLYVWTHEARPEAVVCIWYHPDGRRYHEFQSLSEGPLVAEAEGTVWWKPDEPGIEFREIAGADAPAPGERQRLLQMRNLARRFTAAVSDEKYGRQELRLLSQPVYRYGNSDEAIVDGAIFAFAKGTNPEILVLLEARRGTDGSARWHYAPARMSSRKCEVQYDGRQVWEVPQTRWQRPAEPYRNRVIR